jgi:hypothetical protein
MWKDSAMSCFEVLLNGFLAGMTETKKELSSWLQSLPVF